jgi:hypothetical protein
MKIKSFNANLQGILLKQTYDNKFEIRGDVTIEEFLKKEIDHIFMLNQLLNVNINDNNKSC